MMFMTKLQMCYVRELPNCSNFVAHQDETFWNRKIVVVVALPQVNLKGATSGTIRNPAELFPSRLVIEDHLDGCQHVPHEVLPSLKPHNPAAIAPFWNTFPGGGHSFIHSFSCIRNQSIVPCPHISRYYSP